MKGLLGQFETSLFHQRSESNKIDTFFPEIFYSIKTGIGYSDMLKQKDKQYFPNSPEQDETQPS